VIAVDGSAIVAAIFDEGEDGAFLPILLQRPCAIAWPTVLDCYMTVSRRSRSGVEFVRDWLLRDNVTCEPFESTLFNEAVRAFNRYGKGGGHAAQLSFSSCISYAFARREDLPLLFKGEELARTDIKPAL
jgi:ribonuclease VapC